MHDKEKIYIYIYIYIYTYIYIYKYTCTHNKLKCLNIEDSINYKILTILKKTITHNFTL